MPEPTAVVIHTDTISLDAFLKWSGIADTGGTAKQLVRSGRVLVNGLAEIHPGRKLVEGDVIALGGTAWRVSREAR